MPMPNVMGLYSVKFQNGITTFIMGYGEKQARTLAQAEHPIHRDSVNSGQRRIFRCVYLICSSSALGR